MKWIILSLLIPGSVFAKGLDKLNPETEPKEEESAQEASGASGKTDGEKAADEDDEKSEKAAEKAAEKASPPAPPPAPVPPGFQKVYVGGGLSFINLTNSTGSWNSGTTGDVEAGYRVLTKFQDKYDIYGTVRYRPADVTVENAQRSYRGVVETWLFGAKAQMTLGKLVPFASGELGRSTSSLKPIDGLPGSDESLEKSGVDITIGGGVSYLVLDNDKLAAGARLALGTGAFKTVQFGIDLRYLL